MLCSKRTFISCSFPFHRDSTHPPHILHAREAARSRNLYDSILSMSSSRATKDSHGRGLPTVYPYGSRTVEFVNPRLSRESRRDLSIDAQKGYIERKRRRLSSSRIIAARSHALARSAGADNARRGTITPIKSRSLSQIPHFLRRVDCALLSFHGHGRTTHNATK